MLKKLTNNAAKLIIKGIDYVEEHKEEISKAYNYIMIGICVGSWLTEIDHRKRAKALGR